MRGETKPVQNFPTEKGFSHRIVSRSCRGAWEGARVARVGELPFAPISACESACSCNVIVARRASSLFSRSVERSETYGREA